MEIILKWVHTAILTTISNLLYAFCITMLNTFYFVCDNTTFSIKGLPGVHAIQC